MPKQRSSTPRSPSSSAGSPAGGSHAGSSSSRRNTSRSDLPREPSPRAVAYVRESTEEQGEGFSPDAQREAIRTFAAENGLALVGEYCDFHSGWKRADARPEFQRLMADAAERRFDCVLVYHTSRFARNQVEARRYKQMLRERLGIKVVSVTQPMCDDHSDPSAFLAESIHEMFDEYYSVSLSFWTRTGLREKARQGHIVGPLPWGYVRDPESGVAAPDPERAPLVRELFERYAGGQESDRSLAAWLNAKGARSAKGRPFSKDTVREILLNSAYCGYVGGLRSKDRSVRGLHEPIISEALFDRVQEVRTWRTRVVKPGPPSDDYLLRKLLHCERCGARMHGTRGSRPPVRRYLCSTRRHGDGCDQPITRAEPLEEQLVEWISDFKPGEELRAAILASIRSAVRESNDDATRRRELVGQLERLRDLYVMGDLSKSEYVLRRQALEEELAQAQPPFDPRLDRAEELLGDFGRIWALEDDPAKRRRLLATLFDRVWQDGGTIIAVKPREAFLRYFQTADELARRREKKRGVKSGSDGTRTRDLRRDRPSWRLRAD
jgi:DNA invertase Pin-like site-specific DNA recombinase